jgi:hypothetical protein
MFFVNLKLNKSVVTSIVGIRRRVYRFEFSQQLPDIFQILWCYNKWSFASLGSAQLGLGSLRFILNILASVERSYLAPRLYIWRLWLIPHIVCFFTISTSGVCYLPYIRGVGQDEGVWVLGSEVIKRNLNFFNPWQIFYVIFVLFLNYWFSLNAIFMLLLLGSLWLNKSLVF